MAFEPSAEELAGFADVDAIASWLEMDPLTLEALASAAGATTKTLRTWARIPDPRWDTMVATTAVDDTLGGTRPLSPVEEGQVGELREILRKRARMGALPATRAIDDQGSAGGGGGAANITEQAAAGSAGAQAAVAPEDAPQGLPGTALP